MDAPIETPAPTAPPAPSATDSAATVDTTVDWLCASIETSRALAMRVSSTWASVLPRITLVATAPAPLTATPAAPPNPAASDAAPTRAVIVPSASSHRRVSE